MVRDQSANPVANVCVSAIIDTVTGPDWAGGTSSAPDGSYTLTGLPAATTRVQFDDCNHTGPYLQQWWNQQPTYETATTLAVTPGSATTGIDASLVRAGVITGHVTDREGNPLSGICAQATSDTAFGGLGRTDESGQLHDPAGGRGELPGAVRRLQRHDEVAHAVVGRPTDRRDGCARDRRCRWDRP